MFNGADSADDTGIAVGWFAGWIPCCFLGFSFCFLKWLSCVNSKESKGISAEVPLQCSCFSQHVSSSTKCLLAYLHADRQLVGATRVVKVRMIFLLFLSYLPQESTYMCQQTIGLVHATEQIIIDVILSAEVRVIKQRASLWNKYTEHWCTVEVKSQWVMNVCKK